MKATIGTNCFPYFFNAMFYYAEMHKNSLSIEQVESLVKNKIKTKEIKIGKPPIKDGQSLKVIDNRYHICE